MALKIAYLGRRYHGLEKQYNNQVPLRTIEDVLWKALRKAHLILPEHDSRLDEDEANWEGCEYSKCGRTDKGVSAFGQVIGIRLRSKRLPTDPSAGNGGIDSDPRCGSGSAIDVKSGDTQTVSQSVHDEDTGPSSINVQDSDVGEFCSVNDEIPYVQILNRLLPPDVRVLAWCPSPPPNFSARYSCRERRYKYFFTQPAFAPTHGAAGFKERLSIPGEPNPRREGWLNIDVMRDAAKKFEGLHDFRNFCKVDAGKQMESFERRIFYAGIEELRPETGPAGFIDLPGFQESQNQIPHASSLRDPLETLDLSSTPRIYTFTVHGSGFLWHQVRYMVAILFLIGQGLESPEVIDTLLDIEHTPEKPMYDMADEAPLVLWDCIFPREGGDPHEDGLEWVYASQQTEEQNHTLGAADKNCASGVKSRLSADAITNLWTLWRNRKIDELLAGTLLDLVANQTNPKFPSPSPFPVPNSNRSNRNTRNSQTVFLGGDTSRAVGRYIPVLSKQRRARIEVLNKRYMVRKGVGQDGLVGV